MDKWIAIKYGVSKVQGAREVRLLNISILLLCFSFDATIELKAEQKGTS